MAMLIDILSGLCIAAGVVALLTGSIGLIRLPDLYSRTHAVGMMDTAGVGFIILGLIIHEGFTLISVKARTCRDFPVFHQPDRHSRSGAGCLSQRVEAGHRRPR